jgi:hypothetical protein
MPQRTKNLRGRFAHRLRHDAADSDVAFPVDLPKLRRRDVLRHAWGHIKESWRVALVGALVAIVLPPVYEWANTYHFSHTGLDKVTGGDWSASIVAVGIWLVVVSLWHLLCAPMGHAREVIDAHRAHHADQIEAARSEAKSEVPAIGQYVDRLIEVKLPENAAAAEAAARGLGLRGTRFTAETSLPERVDARPRQAGEPQSGDSRADDESDGAVQP